MRKTSPDPKRKEIWIMWVWAIINEATGEIVDEGIVFEEDARKEAERMGKGFAVELIPM
jgi:hypothetical protein